MNLAYKYHYTEKIAKNGNIIKNYGYINYDHWDKVTKAKKRGK